MSAAEILITGANGFVGTALIRRLRNEPGMRLRRANRVPDQSDWKNSVGVGNIDGRTDWTHALRGIDCVVHCAARVHVMARSDPVQALAAFRSVNVDGTLNLVRQAAQAGVRRLVFVSSIKVNGESTTGRSPFSALDPPAPIDPYGISKWEAEQGLWQIARETGLQVTVVRPPLVYGPGVRANFLRLMRAVERGIPLPFGAVTNLRSMIYVDNLADLLARCIAHPGASGRAFLASDGQDISTCALVRQLAVAMGRRPCLLSVPPILLRVAALLAGGGVAERLLGSLQVDIGLTCEMLDWKPPCTLADGISATVMDFMVKNLLFNR